MIDEPQKEDVRQSVADARDKAERVLASAKEPLEQVADRAVSGFKKFADLEASGGIVLLAAAMAALIVSNSGWSEAYLDLFATKLAVKLGPYTFGKSLLHWINDGLMAIFFFVVGLEIKREFYEGELNSPPKIALPLAAAVGGMIVPALMFVTINAHNPKTLEAWAVPTATDIAFALGVLALVGGRIPAALSVFLLSLAIFDDIGAIIIIAVFYSGKISLFAVTIAAALLMVLFSINMLGIRRLWVFLIVGLGLWLAAVESGVHATLAGILLAMMIPIETIDVQSPLKALEDKLHGWVVFVILPMFAFANAGVSLSGISWASLDDGMAAGIIAGLAIGKPVGVMLSVFVVVALGAASLPDRTNWLMMLGAAMLAGIGFTMSLFVGTLAYETSEFDAQIRFGVLAGSLVAALLGYFALRISTHHHIWQNKTE